MAAPDTVAMNGKEMLRRGIGEDSEAFTAGARPAPLPGLAGVEIVDEEVEVGLLRVLRIRPAGTYPENAVGRTYQNTNRTPVIRGSAVLRAGPRFFFHRVPEGKFGESRTDPSLVILPSWLHTLRSVDCRPPGSAYRGIQTTLVVELAEGALWAASPLGTA
jgi:hypothetical protein